MVDLVFAWVDGSDPAFTADLKTHRRTPEPERVSPRWRARSKYTGQFEQREREALGAGGSTASAETSRFRDSGELRYALRSIEAHAPFIDRIFIVTNGQRPSWIRQDHPKLRFVTHRDIFPDPNVLPSFNSSAIEMNLHRIVDLSDDFIYMNDDFFLGRPVTIDDFKTGDGIYKLFVESSTPLPKAMDDRSLIGHCWAYNHNLIIDHLGEIADARMFAHTPQMYNRWLLQEVELVWREQIEATRANRFRSPFDAHMRLLYTYFTGTPTQILRSQGDRTGLGQITSLGPGDYSFVRFGDERSEFMKDLGRIMQMRPKFFCINDEFVARNGDESSTASGVIEGFLQTYFPVPSSFEKKLPAAIDINVSNVAATIVNGFHVVEVVMPPDADAVIWHQPDGNPHPTQHAINGAKQPDAMIGADHHMRILTPKPAPSFELILAMSCAADLENPLAGFRPDRSVRVSVPHAAGETFKAHELVEGYVARQRIVDGLTQRMASLMGRLRNDPMAAFLKADRAIRTGQKGDQVVRLLEQAMTGGVEPFWVLHRLALVHLARGEHYPQAVDAIRQALEHNGGGIWLYQELAEDLAARGMYGEALPTADGVLLVHPTDIRATYVRSLTRFHFHADDPEVGNLIGKNASADHIALWAKIMRRQKQPHSVLLPVLTKAINGPQRTFDTLVATAMAYHDAGNRPFALMKVAEAMNSGVTGTEAIATARSAEREGYAVIARLLLDAVRARMPWETAAIAPRARLAIAAGDASDETMAELDELVASGQHLVEARLARAALLLAGGKDSEAIAQIVAAGAEVDAATVSAMASEMLHAGRSEAALGVARTLVVLQPGNQAAHQRLVTIMIGSRQPIAKILSAIDQASLAGAPDDWALGARARALARVGDMAALVRLVQSHQAEPAALELLDRIADNLRDEESGDHQAEASLTILRSLAEAQPHAAKARLRWISKSIDNGQIDDGLREALASLPVSDTRSAAHLQRFRVALADGDTRTAAAAIRQIDEAGMDCEPYLDELDRYHGQPIHQAVVKRRSGLEAEDTAERGNA